MNETHKVEAYNIWETGLIGMTVTEGLRDDGLSSASRFVDLTRDDAQKLANQLLAAVKNYDRMEQLCKQHATACGPGCQCAPEHQHMCLYETDPLKVCSLCGLTNDHTQQKHTLTPTVTP